MEEEQVLDCPTVGDFISFLTQFDRSMRLRIEDADTCWTIEKIHWFVEDDAVFLRGEYHEMDGG